MTDAPTRHDPDGLTKAQRAQGDVLRLRWRADLLDYAAAQMESVGLVDEAARKRSHAGPYRDLADAVEAYEAVIAEHGTKGPVAHQAKVRLRTARERWRAVRDDRGIVRFQDTARDFNEPSRRQLLGLDQED